MGADETWPRLTHVEALEPHKLAVRYDDGVEGTVDLSDRAGSGVFAAWTKPGFFADVRPDSSGGVRWGEGIDLCGDALYEAVVDRQAGRSSS